MPSYLAGRSPDGYEGFIFASLEGEGVSAITGRGVQVSELADTLSAQLRVFVRDETGLEGKFYFGFTFRRLDYVNTDSGDVSAPTVFDALEDELGLKLERAQGPVDFLVIEHVETVPTEN